MPFVKGQSGNPGGRGIDKPFLEALRMEINKAGTDHKSLRRVAAKLIEKAENGDMNAIKELADRLDGRPAQTVQGDPERPVTVARIEHVIVDPMLDHEESPQMIEVNPDHEH